MDEQRYREAEQRLWASVGVSPTERRLHLERTDAEVRVQEIGEGPAVLFVHGASNSGASWASLVARLTGFRCVLVDRPGCGLSPPLDTTLDMDGVRGLAESLIADVLDALGLESAHVVATSYGGYTALRTAVAHPERLDRMVHLGWPVGAPITRLPAFMRLGAVSGLGRLMTSIPPTETPISFLWGEDDPFGGAAIARQITGRISNAELEIMPGAGHAVWMDDAAHAAQHTIAFFQR